MSDKGTLTVTGWRRVVLGVVFWLVAFCLMCGLGLAVGLVQAAAAAPESRAPAVVMDGEVHCRVWHVSPLYSPGNRHIRCNYAGGDVGGISFWLASGQGVRIAATCTGDETGTLCIGGSSPWASNEAQPVTLRTTGDVSGPPIVLATVDEWVYSKGGANPPAYEASELVCLSGRPCLAQQDECSQLSFTGPPADRPWRGGEYVNIRVDIPEGVPAPELFFYWPGTVYHPDMWHDSETGYPRDPQIDYPPLQPGDVEIPRFFVNYPDRWAFPSNEFEPLTWFADRTETIRPFRDPRTADGTVGQLRIACAFLRSDGWHLSVMNWDGSTEATPTDYRSCLDLTIDRPNWAAGDPNYPPDPGPWRVFSRTGAALGPLDVEVWDPDAGEWVAWLTALELDAYEVLEEPDSIPPVEIANPDAYSFRCIDEEGELTGGTLGEVDPAKAADGSRENCNESGIGVAPSSWVPGLVRMGSCVARKLFVPGDADIARIRAAGAEASHRAPISFIAEPGGVLIRAFTDAPATIEAHREDCLLIVDVSTLLDGVDDVSACPHSLETTGSSFALSGLRSILATCWWLAFAWFLWSSTRRVMGL